MIATPDLDEIMGAEVVDPNNDTVGKVGRIYLDSERDIPTWVTVKTGLFGLSETLVPIDDATWDHQVLHVMVDKSRIKDAPRIDVDQEIAPEDQERLYTYYERGTGTGAGTGADDRQERPGPDASGRMEAAGHGRHAAEPGMGGESLGDEPLAGSERSEAAGAGSQNLGGFSGLVNPQGAGGPRQGGSGELSGAGAGIAEASRRAAEQDDPGRMRMSDGTADDEAGGAMRMSEGGTAGRAGAAGSSGPMLLKRYVVTEQQTVTMPVTREEYRLEPEEGDGPGR